jgi:hypothetical protein
VLVARNSNSCQWFEIAVVQHLPAAAALQCLHDSSGSVCMLSSAGAVAAAEVKAVIDPLFAVDICYYVYSAVMNGNIYIMATYIIICVYPATFVTAVANSL